MQKSLIEYIENILGYVEYLKDVESNSEYYGELNDLRKTSEGQKKFDLAMKVDLIIMDEESIETIETIGEIIEQHCYEMLEIIDEE